MGKKGLRILFAANPEIAVPTLTTLHQHFDVVGVLTNTDKPTGRGRKLAPPAIKVKALELGIPVLQCDRLNSEARDEVEKLNPNFLLSFACGHYFGPRFLALFDKGDANIHPSLLPQYRGPSPIQYTILEQQKITGISIQRIAKEIDSGDLLSQMSFELDCTETTASLSEKVAHLVPSFAVTTLKEYEKGLISEKPQVGDITHTSLIRKEDALIHWNEAASLIHASIRAYYPWPKAHTLLDGTPLYITEVGDIEPLGEYEGLEVGKVVSFNRTKGVGVTTKDGLLYIKKLQLAQKKEMSVHDFLNGHPHLLHSTLGE
ncbi:MAG: methionyl-tRNA formyltransferase [Sphaerochaetaceae bacterium]